MLRAAAVEGRGPGGSRLMLSGRPSVVSPGLERMAVRRLIVAIGLLAQVLVPVAAVAVDATLVGDPSVSPVPLLPGRAADVVVTLRAAGRETPPVQLEIRVGASVLGRLSDAALGANQTKAYRVTITVPGAASGTLDLRAPGLGHGDRAGERRCAGERRAHDGRRHARVAAPRECAVRAAAAVRGVVDADGDDRAGVRDGQPRPGGGDGTVRGVLDTNGDDRAGVGDGQPRHGGAVDRGATGRRSRKR